MGILEWYLCADQLEHGYRNAGASRVPDIFRPRRRPKLVAFDLCGLDRVWVARDCKYTNTYSGSANRTVTVRVGPTNGSQTHFVEHANLVLRSAEHLPLIPFHRIPTDHLKCRGPRKFMFTMPMHRAILGSLDSLKPHLPSKQGGKATLNGQ